MVLELTREVMFAKLHELFKSPIFVGLIFLIGLDILTGYAKAIKQRNLNSRVSINGWVRHIVVLAIVLTVGVYSRSLGFPYISQTVGIAITGSYGVSVLENLDALGVPFPKSLKKFFEKMREKDVNFSNEQITALKSAILEEIVKDFENDKKID